MCEKIKTNKKETESEREGENPPFPEALYSMSRHASSSPRNVSVCLLAETEAVGDRVKSSRRLVMDPFPALPVLWLGLLLFWVSQSEAEGNIYNVCKDENEIEKDVVVRQNSNGLESLSEMEDGEECFLCLIYPTNTLNCSWSFLTLENDTQIFTSVSFCNDDITVESRNQASVERTGSMSWTLTEEKINYVIAHVNTSLGDKWRSCTSISEVLLLRVLRPPENISLSIHDNNLIIRWDQDNSITKVRCIAFQLQMGDQEKLLTVEGKDSYTVLNADPHRDYSLRMRSRVLDFCYGTFHWSSWSHTAVLEQPRYRLDTLVIILISLGVPMILLAVLLLLRYQRLSKVLFPTIPRPPPKYKYFLERNDPQSFFHPVVPAKPEEEITEVQDADQSPE